MLLLLLLQKRKFRIFFSLTPDIIHCHNHWAGNIHKQVCFTETRLPYIIFLLTSVSGYISVYTLFGWIIMCTSVEIKVWKFPRKISNNWYSEIPIFFWISKTKNLFVNKCSKLNPSRHNFLNKEKELTAAEVTSLSVRISPLSKALHIHNTISNKLS